MAEFWERLAICIFATGFYFAAGARMFGVMQQCGYKNARFYAWLKRRDNLWYNRLCLFFLILLLLLNSKVNHLIFMYLYRET